MEADDCYRGDRSHVGHHDWQATYMGCQIEQPKFYRGTSATDRSVTQCLHEQGSVDGWDHRAQLTFPKSDCIFSTRCALVTRAVLDFVAVRVRSLAPPPPKSAEKMAPPQSGANFARAPSRSAAVRLRSTPRAMFSLADAALKCMMVSNVPPLAYTPHIGWTGIRLRQLKTV